MTAEQVLGVASVLADARPPETPPPKPASPAFDIADDDYVSGAQLKTILERVTQPSANAVELAASGNLGFVRSRHEADFQRYGSEIDALVAQVPPHLRTLDNLERVVRMVRSDHLDEIAQERATQIVAGMEPTLRSTGAAAPLAPVQREHSLASDKIPAEWLERARAAKITEDTVDEFCRANGMSRTAFYQQFDKPTNPTVAEHSTRRNGVSVSG